MKNYFHILIFLIIIVLCGCNKNSIIQEKGEKMFNVLKGAKIVQNINLVEGFKVSQNRLITANISSEKIEKIIEDFIESFDEEELYFFIVVPYNLNDEKGNKVYDLLYNNIYFLDNVKKEELKKIIKPYFDILINDNNTSFGVATMDYTYEVCKYDFNLMRFSSHISLEKYYDILKKNNIYENNDFKSYWDLSTKQKNENDNFYEINGKNIYDIIKELEQYGLYDGGEWKKDTF